MDYRIRLSHLFYVQAKSHAIFDDEKGEFRLTYPPRGWFGGYPCGRDKYPNDTATAWVDFPHRRISATSVGYKGGRWDQPITEAERVMIVMMLREMLDSHTQELADWSA